MKASVTQTKSWKHFYTLNEWGMNFMGWWWLISFIGIMFFLDWVLAPEVNSTQDEGIYFGFIVVSLPLSALSTALYIQLCHLILRMIFPNCYKYYYNKN